MGLCRGGRSVFVGRGEGDQPHPLDHPVRGAAPAVDGIHSPRCSSQNSSRAPYRSGEDPHDFDENKKSLPSPIYLMFQKQLEDGTYKTEESEEFEKKIFNKEGSQYKSYEYDKDSLGKLMIQRFEASKIIAEPARSPSPTSVVDASATIGNPDSIKPLTDAQEGKAPSPDPSIPINASPVESTLTHADPTKTSQDPSKEIRPTGSDKITDHRQRSPEEGGGVFPS